MKPAFMLLLLGGWVSTPADTALEVRPGDLLQMRGLDGMVVIDVWDQPLMEAEAYLDDRGSVSFERRGSRIRTTLSGRGARRDVEIRLRVPPWLAIELRGQDLGVRARGLESDFTVHALSGEITLEDMTGSVQVYATDGEVDVSGLAGTARLRTGDAELTVRDSRGSLDLETVDGEIRLTGIESASVSARSTDGEIDFEGDFLNGGTYDFNSHSGDITLRLTPPVNLEARVLTYGGEFASDFPVRARAIRSGEGMEFTMGAGGASLTVETFNGDIRLHDDRTPMDPKTSESFPKKKRGALR